VKRLVVKDQQRLGPGRTFGLTIAGISVRMFRSLITVAILTLAVTFLCHGLSHTLIVHEARLRASSLLEEYRQPNQWGTRVTVPDSRPVIWRHLARNNEARMAEYIHWAGVEQAHLDDHRRAARRLREYQDYFDSLSDASRIVLLEGRTVPEAIRRMSDPAQVAGYRKRMEELAATPPPGGVEQMAAFGADDLPELLTFTDAAQQGHRRAIEKVQASTGQRSAMNWFARQPDQVEPTLRDAGFTVPRGLADRLRDAGNRAVATQMLGSAMSVDEVSTRLLRILNVTERELTLDRLLSWLTDESNARRMARLLVEQRMRDAVTRDEFKQQLAAELNGDGEELTTTQLLERFNRTYDTDAARQWIAEHLPESQVLPTAEQLRTTAVHHQRQQALLAAVGPLAPEPRTGLFDLPINTRWLIMLSFLVCAVGVANAMFMSVTERFTEIATMKCLGALDGFLMQMFLFESAIQGIVGSILGVILGIGIAMIRGVMTFGTMAAAAAPYGDLLLVAIISLVVGMILAVAAGVGPALAVARLAPMEAMRIE
jgi:hypothetical protein